jgi:hypothetical protein
VEDKDIDIVLSTLSGAVGLLLNSSGIIEESLAID